MAEKSVASTVTPDAPARYEETRQEERFLTPPVDIFENENELTVLADLPGVSKENLNVRVEDNILTIEAKPDKNGKGDSLYREFELATFYRQFQLTETVSREGIDAELKSGVLTLRLPKVEEAKPKLIEVKVS